MAESIDNADKKISEWSYHVMAEDIQDKDSRYKISPDSEEVKRLMRRLDLVGLENVTANITLKRENRRVIKAVGRFSADVAQSCVTTLKPVQDHIEDTFEAWFADPEQAVSFARARHERDKDIIGDEERSMLEEHEDPEPIIDGQIDIGELVTQYLSLALNPFPRCEEAKAEIEEINNEAQGSNDAPRNNPFAALKALKEDK